MLHEEFKTQSAWRNLLMAAKLRRLMSGDVNTKPRMRKAAIYSNSNQRTPPNMLPYQNKMSKGVVAVRPAVKQHWVFRAFNRFAGGPEASHDQEENPPGEGVVKDKSRLMKLNFQHILRGA